MRVLQREKVIVGICKTSKGCNFTSGRAKRGLPFRIPLVPALASYKCWEGWDEDLGFLGVPMHADYAVPAYAGSHVKEPGYAHPDTALRNLKHALASA